MSIAEPHRSRAAPMKARDRRGRALLRAAALRLANEDLSALGALEQAFLVLRDERDRGGQLLAAAYAVQTIAAAYADFREAQRWVSRLSQGRPAMATLCERERLVVCGAMVSAAVIVDTTSFEAPDVRAALENALALLARPVSVDAANDVLAVARALLEYCEQQGQPDTFRRVVDAAAACRASAGPLIAGRYAIYDARCRFRLAAYDRQRPHDTQALAALDDAEALAHEAGSRNLLFDVRYARLLLAAIRNDTGALRLLLERMHEVLDYSRPNCVALYYQHLCRVHLMHDEVAQAFEAANHALRAAELAACVSGERRSYRIMHALALLASGASDRAIAEIEDMLASVSGRPRAILECTIGFVKAWQARQTGDANYRDCLHYAMRQAEELNWPLFLNSLPGIASRLAADALRFGVAGELARRAIGLRQLPPPADADDRWPWPLRIYTLGRFTVLIGDESLAFSAKAQRKPLELLKFALALGARGVEPSEVMARLWPDLEGDASRNAFDLALHRLRKLLRSEDAVSMREGRLVIDAAQVWVDVRAFDVTCASVEGAVGGAGGQPYANELAERLLRYYVGHFLPGEEAQWILGMRERLRSKFLRTLSTLGERLEHEGDWNQAVVLYRRAVEVDPLLEEFHRRLMICYRAQHRIAEALDAYRHCRDIISITLGIAPSPATEAIYRSLKRA
jgi:LuxR family transcriptional regulator, maltose regulon positive regulatory protein